MVFASFEKGCVAFHKYPASRKVHRKVRAVIKYKGTDSVPTMIEAGVKIKGKPYEA